MNSSLEGGVPIYRDGGCLREHPSPSLRSGTPLKGRVFDPTSERGCFVRGFPSFFKEGEGVVNTLANKNSISFYENKFKLLTGCFKIFHGKIL
jgi:hypothetical protein